MTYRGLLGAGLGNAWESQGAWRGLTSVTNALASTSTVRDKMSKLLIFGVMLNHIESRGWVRITSNDPHTPPAINPNYCSDPRDVEKLKWAARQCVKMAIHPEFYDQIESVNFPEPLVTR